MPGPFFILSGTLISQQELSVFAVAHGGHTTSDLALSNVMSQGTRHVWFGLSSQAELESEREGFKNRALEKLGRLPETCVTVEVSDGEGSSAWALEFSIMFLEKWRAVVDDFCGPLMTLSDLKNIRDTKQLYLSRRLR